MKAKTLRKKLKATSGDNPKAVVRQKKGFGKAVYADRPIRKGETVAVIDGAFISGDEWDDMSDSEWKYLYTHAIQVGEQLWRASEGIADQLNHSCEPNCGIRGYYEIVAMRDIAKGEELTWDYEMAEDYEWDMKCECGSPKCRKVIGVFKNMPEDVKKKYKGYISEWLVKKYSLKK